MSAAAPGPSARSSDAQDRSRLTWVDALKGIALLWIVLNHLVERIFGSEYFGNPSATWPALHERIAQLAPLTGHGIAGALLNAVRYIGWTGDTGVGLFLLASGFALTYGLARVVPAAFDIRDFYRRRALRVYPLWWCAHLFFAFTWLLTGWGIPFTHLAMYASMLGIRFTPGLFDYFSSSWWFIGLLIQLYLVFPLLWWALRARGPLWFFLVSCAIGLGARLGGLLFLHSYMPEWERGAIFLTRLPEFAAGMSLAAYWASDAVAASARLRSPVTVVLGAIAFAIGFVASFTLIGNTVSPLLMTAGSFALVYAAIAASPAPAVSVASWFGIHSYSLYLVNQPLIVLLVPAGLVAGGIGLGADIAIALILIVLLALLLEAITAASVRIIGGWWRAFGLGGAALRTAASLAAAIAVCASAELVVERFWPQEVYGWGELASLQPDPQLGWRMIPDSTTRLRWLGYDYTVEANRLGFPGPWYPPGRPRGTMRIMTLGDAFTSAEGVNTDASWPRLLENDLQAHLGAGRVQVLDFAVTGYGPAQFESIVRDYVPTYRPNIVIIGFFVKDFGDVLRSVDAQREAVGFDLPRLPAWKRVLLMYHARRLLQTEVLEPLAETITGVPRAQGYALSNARFFERNEPDLTHAAPGLLEQKLAAIAAIDRSVGARTLLIMIPAALQVCPRRDLPYLPAVLHFDDKTEFDLDLPQREAAEISRRVGIEAYDLRPELEALNACPYQPRNMHWTEAGHEATADFLSARLSASGYRHRPLTASRTGPRT